ncbi:MAG: IreB family regulatory phosphoprotein [Oscillospiraceae bacterium]|nr:IreB family regulatory phosphoprotein [Oscillospiraceae bacterium]
MSFSIGQCEKKDTYHDLHLVYSALEEKGYNPINQIVGFIRSGDPTYITAHNNARSIICKYDRDEIMRIMLRSYLDLEPITA